ncbi:hypothetical protein RPPX_19620 [Pseudomonas putida S12]|jgi:hypothetical protein|uniref:Lipoprotein n=1 Tax=Pseudomonas putida S12 TaxID=1215087 RepID=A0AA34RXM2_PSEPU|nr:MULTISPECIES: hypothetical protein [Pseudomonas]ADR60801.1 Hypothetical protein, conserved [Pseudomonas putida BIRD-1]AJA15466.1 hypothetical protein RPPX_19620 [Pseudomonas putida S12]RIZ40135.1 hypothetical protein CIK02_10820 [Pseudomonas putida]USX36082.1 hypothetical protein NH673_23235 [Pseudomonas putida]
MTRLALCLLLLATGASAEQFTPNVEVIHDDKRAVTCWVYSGHYYKGGISWIPDSQLQAGNERQLSPHETQPEPTPALAPGRWTDERYQPSQGLAPVP